jgi:putative SbcD/Mre11-related phosphoesterase
MRRFFDWLLTPERVAVHMPTATAVVADLHLGYQEARKRCGDALPLADMGTILAPLQRAFRRCRVKHLIVAGDLFERAFDLELWRELRERLAAAGVDKIALVPGNHDRGLDAAPPELTLLRDGHALGAWHVVHGDGDLPPAHAVLGHFHPCVRYQGRKVPCYLASSRLLALPAYSKDAAGVNVQALKRWRDCCCFAIAAGKVFEVAQH